MTSMPRTLLSSAILALFLIGGDSAAPESSGLTLASQVTATPAQQTTQSAPPPARAVGPELKAYQAALAVADPAARLEALRKFQADYPSHPMAWLADEAIIGVLVTGFKDREGEITAAFEKFLKSIPAASTADARLTRLQSIAAQLVDNNLLLDRVEALFGEALGKLDRDEYVKSRRTSAEQMRKWAESRTENQTTPLALPPGLIEIPSDATSMAAFDRMRAGALEVMGRIHLAKDDAARAEREFKEAFEANPQLTRAPLELAKIASARGDDRAAVEYYLSLALTGKMKRTEEDAFAVLYRKIHGSSANLESDLDRLYREKYPNPVSHPDKYTGSLSGRVALIEMFTGSACSPCVSADLALDAVLERYPAESLAVLAYHVHIPGPDPMTVPACDYRKTLYAVPGVPTFNVDGARTRLGGGSREGTPNVYKAYIDAIDKSLQTPSEAGIKVTALLDGSKVRVRANVSGIKARPRPGTDNQQPDLHLHLILAERNLKFVGENGIRFHAFVVRDAAGEKAGGLPIANLAGETTVEHTFDLALIPDVVAKCLADEIARRRKTEPAGATPREYRAEGRGMTAVETAQLVVVAFVQEMKSNTPAAAPAQGTTATPSTSPQTDATVPAVAAAGAQAGSAAPTYRVLQAAWSAVKAAAPSAVKE